MKLVVTCEVLLDDGADVAREKVVAGNALATALVTSERVLEVRKILVVESDARWDELDTALASAGRYSAK
jgi:hypothetical protein